MLGIIFGWRKASKCKKLIRKVQCRLKLLKNKRCTIVRQLRDDVGQLLKHGHFQSAFNRVEQIYKDECIVTVYDLLDHFCEFIIIHLYYIRRHKDCPNDINEAISTLIFASARCGDLPELRVIRKLFGERYGQRFTSTALDLLPGNLVNNQMRDNLSISSVDNDVKYRLVDEIARNCLKSGPLALEYTSEFHLQQANKNDDFVPSHDISREPHQEDTYKGEAEGKYVHAHDISSESKSFFEEPAKKTSQEIIKSYNFQLDCPLEHKEGYKDNESSSENLSNVPEEIVYLDDIEEFPSPMNKEDDKGQDQRVFMFKHIATPKREKYEAGYESESEYEEQYDQSWKKKSTEKGEKRSSSLENGKSYIGRVKLEHPCIVKLGSEFVQGKFVCFKDETDQVVKQHNCSLENPCYHSINDEEKEEKIENQVHYKTTSGDHNNLVLQPLSLYVGSSLTTTSGDHLSKMQTKKMDSTNASMCSCSTGTSPDEIKQTRPPYLRAITMPLDRPEDCWAENNIGRSYSFPYEQPSRFSSSSPHVHPKLPDYDELAAKFMALKKANLQK